MAFLKTTTFLRLKAAIAAFSAVFAVFGVASARPAAGCISFESPLTGAILSLPSCTVAVNVTCANVARVDLQAHYYAFAGGDTAITVHLASLARPPYKYLWNIEGLPNQLFTGVSVTATAVISGGESQIARQEGIFLAHHPIERNAFPIHFMPGNAKLSHDGASSQVFDMQDPRISAYSLIVWNDRELVIDVNVKNSHFYRNRTGEDMTKVGLEVLIDPKRGKSPYPDGDALHFVIPLSGAPYKIAYRAESHDGEFKLVQRDVPVGYAHTVAMGAFRGYSVRFAIPQEAFGRMIPDTISANLALRIFNDDNQIQKIPLHGEGIHELYSPLTWPYYYRLPKPLLMNVAFQWTLFPFLGFLAAVFAYIAIMRLRMGSQFLSNFERSEEEMIIFNRVNAAMKQELAKQGLKIDDIAAENGMTPRALNNLIKRSSGFSFTNYLQFCRTEAAKKLLRSSRYSEKSVADRCGFASAIEMERYFIKFHRVTPYKYRLR